jgi:hypothetical protein
MSCPVTSGSGEKLLIPLAMKICALRNVAQGPRLGRIRSNEWGNDRLNEDTEK